MGWDLPDDNSKTVFCRTCGEWRHPRHACARDERHETAPLPVLKLRRDGPSGPSVFGEHRGAGPNVRQKHAIAKFDLSTRVKGTTSRFGQTSPVYYLDNEHAAKSVLREWIRVNEENLAGRDLTIENVTRGLSTTAFEDAWQELVDEQELEMFAESNREYKGGGQSDQTCPFCGAPVGKLPSHLPCDGD